MHDPRTKGRLVVGEALTGEDEAAVELLARRLTNLKTLSGVDSMKMVRALPDGGYVIAQDAGGVFRTIIHKPEPPPPPPAFEGVAVDYIPMLFSGVVTSALVPYGEGVGIRLTKAARRRLAGYSDEVEPPPADLQLQRFAISYNPMVKELEPQYSSPFFFSQYVGQRPTWYSGAMAEVMQIVGGYGRHDFESLPDDPVERARLLLPSHILDRVKSELAGLRLPGYTGLPPRTGQFQYDYKFNSTNGVSFDTDNKPWLIRVAQNGVWAMPLPLVPATTTQAFREYMEEVGDEEILKILDRFGGMPSGETFLPPGEAFEAWRRAGVIIKVCDVADFYQHSPYSSACGWSFNLKGTEGYNTCCDYYDDEGLGYGLAYKMKLFMAPVPNGGNLPPRELPTDPADLARMSDYLSKIYALMRENKPSHVAIKYKLRRADPDEILSRAFGSSRPEAELEYWDALEMDPIANHSGSVTEVGRGYLYHPAPFENQPQIKFPEPFMGGCVSYDFLPLDNGRGKDKYPNCDTIMFGYYIGDDLRVVKYFRDDRTFFRDVESDFEVCMTVGSWTEVVTTGNSTLAGNFSTSDIDDRRELPPSVTTTRITGIDRGYDAKPWFAFDEFFATTGTLWRNRYVEHRTVIDTTEGQALNIAICIPYLCRNAVIHAKKETVTSSIHSEHNALSAVQDPYSYRYWTYHRIFAWSGSLEKQTGEPFPEDGNPVWVEIERYNPSVCSDFADQGPWINGLPADYTWLIHPDANVWQNSGGGGAPSFNSYNRLETGGPTEEGDLKVSILDYPGLINNKVPPPGYFVGSPSDLTGVFYRNACKVVFGDTVYANVWRENPGEKNWWGYCSLADHDSAHHFIGVINE